jgi:2',3'-cyclic-nucleotide 2'-phosphodiesterase (5'-nucleotidase family)
VLSSNLYDSTKNDLLVEPYLIGNNGMLNVAIIGAITNDMRTLALPKNLEGIGILDQFAEIRKYVAEVEPITDLIILLSHNGLEEDSLLANQLTGVDVIIGGHSHSYLRQPMRVNNILICQAGSNGRNLGMLKVFVNKEQKNITEFKYESIETRVGRVRPSGEVARIVDSLETSIAGEMETVIGQLITDWKRNSHGESNIGNWICDATRAYFKADMAFMNSGGIRKDLKAGPIRVRDLWEISPFDNTIEKVEVTGKQLRYMMQYRLDNPRDLLQVSGLAYEYGRQTNKIVKLTVNGKPIKDNNRYVFVTNNFVTGQFERFFGIAPTEVKIIPTGVVGRDILIAAVKDQKRIDSRVEKRIVEKR